MKNDNHDAGIHGITRTEVSTVRPPFSRKIVPSWISAWIPGLFVFLCLFCLASGVAGYPAGTRFYELRTQLSHYIHTESPGGRPDVVASKFGVLAHNLKITAPHSGLFGISTGTSGIWWEYRFQQTGGSVFTPDTMQFRWAGFTHERYSWDRIQLDVGARLDALYLKPPTNMRSETSA